MKLKKIKTLNEAISEISDVDQGVVGIVFADAIRETKNKRQMIDKAFKDRKIEMPNEDRFAHEKVNVTKEMKKMQLAESLFTEWVDQDTLTESFAQPNFAVSEDQYVLDDTSGNITISKDIFSDYIKDGHVNILFVDEAEDGEDKVLEYKMIAEDDSNITMEYVGVATPGIDEEIANCQKYPIEKPKAKDSTYVSAEDKQPRDTMKAKDSQFISAGDKQPNKAAMKESKLSNYDKTVDRIKTIFAQTDWSKVKKDTEKSDDGKKQIKDYFNKNGLTDYADLLDKVTIYLTGDSNVIGYAKPADNSITLNRELDIRSAAEIVKHELDNLNKNGLKESFTNWDSPESRIERYETDLPELMTTMHDNYMQGRLAAEDYAQALKIAYDALDSVPQIDEALEASQKYPIEKPEAKDSQYVSAEDKQPSTAIDAKDSQFVSAGDKNPNEANKELVKESMLVEADEEKDFIYVYKNKRDPLADIIQVELTEGEWGYVKYPDGRLSPTRLPSANYLDDRVGADWDKNDQYAITVLGESADELQKAIEIATKYGKEYRIEQLARPIKNGLKTRIWIYVDEEKDFDEPYFDPNVDTIKGKSEEESLEASQKYPIESPFEAKDSEFVSAEDKDPNSYNKELVKESIEEIDDLDVESLNEIRITTEGLNNFKPYGEAAQTTWATIQNKDKIATFEFMLEDMYPNGIGSTQLNDLLAYNRDWIYDMLNINDSDESDVSVNEVESETIDDSFDW